MSDGSKNDLELEKRFDALLRQNVRAVPVPPSDHEGAFFGRLKADSRRQLSGRRSTYLLIASFLAAAAVWFFQVRTIETDPDAVIVMEESVEAYNVLLEDDDEVYSLLALVP